MNRYRVAGGTAKFGPGQVLGLDAKQLVARAHQVNATNQAGVVTAKQAMEFKVGEVISLPGIDKRMGDFLVPLDEPKGVADEAALQKHEAAHTPTARRNHPKT